MELTRLLSDDEAVTPAFGIVLLGLVIILVAVAVGFVVFTASDSPGEPPPQAGFVVAFDDESKGVVDDFGVLYGSNSSEYNGSYDRVVDAEIPGEKIGLVRLRYTDGPPLEVSRLKVEGNRLTETERWATAYSGYNTSDTLTNGEEFTLWMHVEDELRITWERGDGTAVLQRYERPDR
ncbi:hypothetical protein [Halovenus halobia]|uniref:hypothetical protein n=1 Tax=Halovenus halobia TaxID=3396622 RepID=UPI003F5546F0